MTLDVAILFFLNGFAGQSAYADDLIIGLATYLPWVLGGVFVLWLYFRVSSWRTRAEYFFGALVASLIARFGIVSPIRFFYPRPRPFVMYHLHQLIPENLASFPSGHSAFLFAFSAFIFCVNRKLGLFLFLGTTLCVLARIAAGVHYPSDILAGAIVGVPCGYLTYRYLLPYATRKIFPGLVG